MRSGVKVEERRKWRNKSRNCGEYGGHVRRALDLRARTVSGRAITARRRPAMLDGVRVIEMGLWVAGPAAAGILADWGADVVKIEPPSGDPMRAFFQLATGSKVDRNPPFDLDNRGKRSIVLDVRTAEGRDAADRLLARADVFITNFRPDALARLGLDPETLTKRFPRVVYASITGYGRSGPERDRPGYDVGAFWARSGVAATLAPEGVAPPMIRGGFGDHVTAITTVAGIVTALYERERSGRGRVVETSLLRTGAYCLGWDLGIQLAFGKIRAPVARTEVETPLVNSYRAGCGGWFWLIGLEADRHFPGVARAIEREDLLADPRFASARERRRNCREIIAELDRAFATRPLVEWAERFDREGVWWAPVQTLDQVVADAQAEAAGAFVDAPVRNGGSARAVASPVGFGDATTLPRAPSPMLGEHTEAVLREAGLDDAAIAALRAKRVIPG
jgi:crotonobetainyl-CoA:carnitine CoA-transferase CaiB-like acyl-CoA transferase